MSEISTRNHPKSTGVVTVAAKAFIMHIRTLRQFTNEKKTNITDNCNCASDYDRNDLLLSG